jgi:hypothetical protein
MQIKRFQQEKASNYFKIKIFCAETHKCAFCLLKVRFKQDHEICKSGCQIPNTNEQIKYILNMFKKLEIIIDWVDTPIGESFY